MATKIIVSYDGTDNDRDALALGELFARHGAEIGLAYVRHAHEPRREREALEEKQAEQLRRGGALSIDRPETPQHVIVHASTGEGLAELAEREGADLVVFGSEYRTAPGAVEPGTSARWLLKGGRVAIAIAPAELRTRGTFEVARLGVLGEAGDDAPEETARSLAAALGGEVSEPGHGRVDLLVVGSRDGTSQGRLELSATAEYAIETASSPVLAVPRGAPVSFGAVSHA
jgi:nucleotide-binding universal stress UspA family protein